MKCDNCIHYRICQDIECLAEDEHCNGYEDKRNFIKLPCQIGDTIYFINCFINGILSGEIEEIIFDRWGWKIRIKQGRVFEDRELGAKFFTSEKEVCKKMKESEKDG